MRRLLGILIFFSTLTILNSCSITRRVPEGEYLLTRSRIEADNKKVNTRDLRNLKRQQPNRRILGFYRFHLRTYNLADYGRENWIKSVMKNTIGEPPVILDTVLVNTTMNQHLLYLRNKGFFNAEVDKKINYRRKKAAVTYIIKAGTPYTINKIEYTIEDSHLKPHIYNDTTNALLNTGDIYDVTVMQKERERLSNMLKNRGYYKFSRDFVAFEVDSALGDYAVNINVLVRSPVVRTTDSLQTSQKVRHKRYLLNDIYINPQHTVQPVNIELIDTTEVLIPDRRHEGAYNNYFFILRNGHRINPPIITQSIFFRKGRYFNLEDVEQTYKRLSELRNFRFINIQFFENKDTLQDHDFLRKLDSRIELTQMPPHYYDLASDVTNSGGNLGLAGNISYQNRNLFRNAEIFSIRLNGALEAQNIIGSVDTEEVIEQLPFNTIETGVSTRLEIPMFLIPVSIERFPKYFRPKTTFTTGFNFQQRPDYTRYITNASFGYEWRETMEKTHMLNPFEISSVKITPDSSFVEVINNIEDRRLQLSYKDHLAVSLKYSFIYNTQKIDRLKNFSYFRGNIETSGNLLRAANYLLNSAQDEFGSYKLFNIRYAQFVKFDIDYRYYHILNERTSLVFRTAGGLGLPYKNLNVMPFDKSFFAGGANSIRAWKLYQLGPGGYSDDSKLRLYRTGDIHIEGNVEYRFDVYKYLKGALFIDAGNIWFREKNEQFPEAEFRFDNFYNEIAIGGGAGARLDFSFFIVRLDAAIPFRDPAREQKDRWVFDNIKMSRVNFNLGIGYPF